jgi:hypothetical protein
MKCITSLGHVSNSYIKRERSILPNLAGIHNYHLVDNSCCSSQQQFPMQQLQNCRHLLYRLNNPIMHILVPCILYKIKIVFRLLVTTSYFACSYAISKLLELSGKFIPSKIHKIITDSEKDNFITFANCKLITDVVLYLYPHKLYDH